VFGNQTAYSVSTAKYESFDKRTRAAVVQENIRRQRSIKMVCRILLTFEKENAILYLSKV